MQNLKVSLGERGVWHKSHHFSLIFFSQQSFVICNHLKYSSLIWYLSKLNDEDNNDSSNIIFSDKGFTPREINQFFYDKIIAKDTKHEES